MKRRKIILYGVISLVLCLFSSYGLTVGGESSTLGQATFAVS